MPIPFIAVAIVGALALGGGVAVTVSTINEANNADEAIIDRVIDGDTVDVRMYGDVHRVRLLNIDSPEDNAATGVAECMGPKATAALVELLPKGSTVTLRYDSERYDRYDRLLAGIFVKDTLINAEMAREGLASPMVVGENTRFIEEVQSAESVAKANEAGIFGTALPCTLGSIVTSYSRQASAAVESTVPRDSAGITEVLATTTLTLEAADGADLAIDGIDWVAAGTRGSYKAAIDDLRDEVKRAENAQSASYTSAVAREKATAKRLAAAEAARVAAAEKAAAEQAAAAQAAAEQAAAEQAAAEQAAAEQAAAEQAAWDAAQRQTSNDGSSVSDGGSSSGDGGGSTYTGCRNYNGYGMIDTKGRHFEPIPCP